MGKKLVRQAKKKMQIYYEMIVEQLSHQLIIGRIKE